VRVAIYARYSSENQRHESIEDQVRQCRDHAQRCGHTVSEVFADQAISGSRTSRPGLDALLAAAKDKAFDGVIVDDTSRLSRENRHLLEVLAFLRYHGVNFVSVSDGIDTRDDHAKLALGFLGVINESFLNDLKKKTHRGQEGQVRRGFNVGAKTYGYVSVAQGQMRIEKGRARWDGHKLEVAPEQARVVRRIFDAFIGGRAITAIVKALNEERVPTATSATPKRPLKAAWTVSTVSRILKNAKYVGHYVWNRTESRTEPRTGRKRMVQRPREQWIVDQREEMRIVSDEVWAATEKRWAEIQGVHPKGKRGFSKKQGSYVVTHPPHLLSGNLRCGACGKAIGLASGKGGGYYGCLAATNRACTNSTLISRKRLEQQVIRALTEQVLRRPDVIEEVYARTAEKVAEEFARVPDELRLKQLELAQEQKRIKNFVEYIASGKATPALGQALQLSEDKAKSLEDEVAGLEATKSDLFEPPPQAWIDAQLEDLGALLARRTEASALVVRRLTGAITLTPECPEVGRRYYRAHCEFNTLVLLEPLGPSVARAHAGPDRGSNSLQWWRRGESNPGPQDVSEALAHVRIW